MAALIRLQTLANLRKLLLSPSKNVRFISTSKKNRDTVSVPVDTTAAKEETTTITKNKNWVSYGFDHESEVEDRNVLNSTFFTSITLCLVFGGFMWAYLPDPQMRDWAQREGFLELRRREEAGLPLIDRNYIAPEEIVLPSDEELGEIEIII